MLCVLEREVQADDQIPVVEAEERFRGLVTALRLWAPGAIALCAPGLRRSGEGRWGAVGVGGPGTRAARPGRSPRTRSTTCASSSAPSATRRPADPWDGRCGRFEMGCERPHEAEALSDYLLGLRALLDATSEAGEASLALRVAALCAEEGSAAPCSGGSRRRSPSSGSSWAAAGASRSGSAPSPRATSCERWRRTCVRCCATSCAATSSPT